MENAAQVAEVEEHWIATNADLHVRVVRGQDFLAETRPIVFVHGDLGSASQWDGVIDLLGGATPMLVTFDQRGHGRSGPCSVGDYSARARADDLACIVEAVATGPALVVAHGSGSVVALELARSNASLVAGLLLVDPPGDTPRLRLEATRPDAAAVSPLPAGVLRDLLCVHPAASIGVSEAWQACDLGESLAALRVPTHVLLGAEAQRLRRWRASGCLRVEVVAGAGHWLHIERPERVVHALGTLSRAT